MEGLEKEEDCPKWRLVVGDRILDLCRIVTQTLLKGAQTPSPCLPIQGDMESLRLRVLTPLRNIADIHLTTNLTDLTPRVGCAAEK